ncbi:MAG TPA: molybdopterin cofactor-binding domain-containing protein [Stellaceae bacterium]|jgi:isoquinoline 1-oxidoreductase beta subunit|nr:molybdopterin cofactor-binding domain-containing protein [Stellaceae bacterium]
MDGRDLLPSLDRRRFMIGSAGLTFGFAAGVPQAVLGATAKQNVLSPWVTISTDGTIAIMSPAVEMGEGSFTALPVIVAEELDADWSKVRIVRAPVIDALYANPQFGFMYTASSNAVTTYFTPLRRFGAQVRKVLLANAAQRWGVSVTELATEPSMVVHEKSGRRLDYGAIAAFAEVPAQAPEVKDGELKPTNRFRLIGHSLMRVELLSKVNGSAQYSIDMHPPGLVYGAVLRAPVEGAAPDKIDDAKARAVTGIIDVVQLPYGVGVVAKTSWAAFAAKNALAVTWTRRGKAWGFDSDKGRELFAAAARDTKTPGKLWDKQGEALRELDHAAMVVEAEYSCEFIYHAQMEPLNAVAAVSPQGDSVELWAGVQSQSMAVRNAAEMLGVTQDKVVLHDMLLGGGFGRRGHQDMDFVNDAVLLSKAVRRPVKMMWTREDDFHNGRFFPLAAHYLRAGFDQSGKLVAFHHRKASDEVTKFQFPEMYEKYKGRDTISFTNMDFKWYEIPAHLAEAVPQDSGVRVASLRGVAHLSNIWAIESFIDELARKRGSDPAQFRRGLVAHSPRSLAVIDAVMRMSDWGKKRSGTALGIGFQEYSRTLVAEVAEVSVDRRTGAIRVHNVWVAIDPGIAVQPENVVAQTEGSVVYGLGFALSEKISIRDGVVEQSNFNNYHVPRMNEIPAIHVEVISTDNHPTGAGQIATPLVAPVIANGVAELTGVRLRHAPMTKEQVLAALKA